MSDTAYPVFQHYGTHAQRLAFTPSPPSSGQPIYIWYETDTGNSYLYDTSWHQITTTATGNVTAAGTLTNNALVIGQGTTAVATTTTGTGILTALGINTGSAGAPVLFNGALGTPSSGTLTNATGLPASALAAVSSIYINLQDQKTQNTPGGTFSSGAWRTRTLNTEQSDVGGLCSLASNQMTLAAGTYVIHATAPAYLCGVHQTRLFNVTDTAVVLVGQCGYCPTSGDHSSNVSIVSGLFTVAASKALEIQHQCGVTSTTFGFGNAANFTTEVYTIVELWKIG